MSAHPLNLNTDRPAVWQGTAASHKNLHQAYDKPNEDVALADNERGIYMVLDGVSRTCRPGMVYPFPSPAAVAAGLFAEAAHASLLVSAVSLSPAERLRAAAEAGNAVVAAYNAKTFPQIDWLENNPAGAVGILGLLVGREFHYAYLGDCSGWHVRGTKATLFTRSQTAPLRGALSTLGLSGEQLSICSRRDICNNPVHPYGYGVFTGAPAALEFLEQGVLALEENDIVVLATDGLDPLFETSDLAQLWPFEPEELVLQTEQIEEEQPEIRSDDKTVVVIRRQAPSD